MDGNHDPQDNCHESAGGRGSTEGPKTDVHDKIPAADGRISGELTTASPQRFDAFNWLSKSGAQPVFAFSGCSGQDPPSSGEYAGLETGSSVTGTNSNPFETDSGKPAFWPPQGGTSTPIHRLRVLGKRGTSRKASTSREAVSLLSKFLPSSIQSPATPGRPESSPSRDLSSEKSGAGDTGSSPNPGPPKAEPSKHPQSEQSGEPGGDTASAKHYQVGRTETPPEDIQTSNPPPVSPPGRQREYPGHNVKDSETAPPSSSQKENRISPEGEKTTAAGANSKGTGDLDTTKPDSDPASTQHPDSEPPSSPTTPSAHLKVGPAQNTPDTGQNLTTSHNDGRTLKEERNTNVSVQQSKGDGHPRAEDSSHQISHPVPKESSDHPGMEDGSSADATSPNESASPNANRTQMHVHSAEDSGLGASPSASVNTPLSHREDGGNDGGHLNVSFSTYMPHLILQLQQQQQQLEMLQQKQQRQEEEIVEMRSGVITRLEAECSDQKNSIQCLQQEKETLQGENARLEEVCKDHQKDIQCLQQEKEKLQGEVTHLETECSDQRNSIQCFQQEKEALQGENARLEEECKDHQKNIQCLQQEKGELQGEFVRVETEYTSLKTAIHCLQQENGELREKSTRLQAENSEKLNEFQRLYNESRKFQADTERITDELREKDDHLRGLMDVITKNTDEKERAVAENQQNLNRLQASLNENQHLRDSATASRQKEMMFRTQVVLRTVISRRYRASMETLQRQYTEMQTELNKYRAMCAAQQLNLRDALNQVQEKSDELVTDQETHDRERRELKGSVQELTEQLEELQASSQREVDRLTADRDAARTDVNQLTDTIGQLEADKEQWTEDKQRMEEQFQRWEQEHVDLTTRIKVLENQKKTAEEQSVKYGEETTVMNMHVAQLQTAYLEKERQFQEATSAHNALLQDMTERLRERERQVIPLENEAQRATLETRNFRSQLENMEREKRNLETTIAALKEEVERGRAATADSHRRLDALMVDLSNEKAQKVRYVKETENARRQIKGLEDQVKRFRMRQN